MVEASKKLPVWRKAIEDTARQAMVETIDRPVIVQADFFLPKPKHPRFTVPATAPDTDKLMRALGDGLEKSGLLSSDSRIVQWVATKHYGEQTGCQVTVFDYGTTVSHFDFKENI